MHATAWACCTPKAAKKTSLASTLDAAHRIDPFNVETTNYLRLLDDLKTFARKESAHFIVMYDGKKDPLIGEYFNDYLEGCLPGRHRRISHRAAR